MTQFSQCNVSRAIPLSRLLRGIHYALSSLAGFVTDGQHGLEDHMSMMAEQQDRKDMCCNLEKSHPSSD